MERPYVWQMIKEAVENLGGKATYPEIKNYIFDKWGEVNNSTINAQCLVLSVNQPSRIHYTENHKPRFTNGNLPYDVLFSTGKGQVVLYNPEEHGIWEIYKNDFDGLEIRQQISNDDFEEIIEIEDEKNFVFPLEANLRDFLIKNLDTVKGKKLSLYIDENGRDGREYQTKVGLIDILAIDEKGNFVVFELKLNRGMDRALGQLLRYMGWIKKELAGDKKVSGIIVANKMDEKIKYAVSIIPDISLWEYQMTFELNKLDN
ncbi:DUF91 domain-containing protein [Flavobacterium salilacus subsp. salilacus]|uniref:endonuclease NucS domain-containing protein n=1 Tax=Flavobacterium TaxID=237 RepID=UPI0010750E8F|nr:MULTISPECIES: endonuclease NucS domain-containing protein [Flavobacterium]KAF2519727.1 DUF91 domain-containing protein [Flavobacterium salilacus subsp. salilacus]MBE1614383.1 DUF91 domain-containing protein [Flavobacterium sp. SaA2.13]